MGWGVEWCVGRPNVGVPFPAPPRKSNRLHTHHKPTPQTQQELAREHRWAEVGGSQCLGVKDGRVYVDVRDSGDAWVRVAVGKGEAVVLPNGLWRYVEWRFGVCVCARACVDVVALCGGGGDQIGMPRANRLSLKQRRRPPT